MFIKTFFLSLITYFIIWIFIIFAQFGNPTKMSQWVYDVYQKKENIAKNIKGQKIVIVAGSNALFGIDSKLLSKYFKLPVLNYGVNAGIDLPLTLHLAKRVINKNDIVLAPLEYSMYLYNREAGVQMIDYLFSREPSFFWKLTLKEQFYILWHTTLKRVLDGYLSKGGEKITTGVYGVHHIDNNGDQIETKLSNKTPYMYKEIEKHKNNPEKYGHNFKTDTLSWNYLENFVNWCREKNVTVIFMPPAFMRNKSYLNNPIEKKFYQNIGKIIENRGWIYIGNPFKFMYNSLYFFNTNYHLINKGRFINTKLIISNLKKTKKYKINQ